MMYTCQCGETVDPALAVAHAKRDAKRLYLVTLCQEIETKTLLALREISCTLPTT